MGTLLAAATVIVFFQVIFRYFLLQPLAWGEESARFLFIWVSLLGAALAVKDRAHFSITMLVSHFPPSLQKVLTLFITICGSILFWVLVTEGWRVMMLNRNQESPAIGMVMSIPYAAIPLGGALSLFFLWADVILKWDERGNPEEGAGMSAADSVKAEA